MREATYLSTNKVLFSYVLLGPATVADVYLTLASDAALPAGVTRM